MNSFATKPAAARVAADDPALGRSLLALARGAIGERFGRPAAPVAEHEAHVRPGASFVTLLQAGQLRGCVGSLEPHRALRHDVRENARSAAFRDPRFPPLAAREFESTTVEVSLLSAAEPLDVAGEDDLLSRLRPGVDGLILALGSRRATFLPQVWKSLPDPADFVAHLKRKAGLPVDAWNGEIRCARYSVAKWSEDDARSGGVEVRR